MSGEESPTAPSAKRSKVSNDVTCETVNLNQWLHKTSSHLKRLPLIDLRPKEDFEKRHLRKDLSTIVNLPFSDLISGERSCELPPRNTEFALLVPAQIDGKEIEDFFFATTSKATLQSRKPWLVRQIIQETSEFWKEAKRLEIMSNSSSGVQSLPMPRLWKPDQMVEHKLLPMLKDRLENSNKNENIVIWDLGSGAGRDVCFLAEELMCSVGTQEEEGFTSTIRVVGFDNHKGSPRRSAPLWKNRMVHDSTESRLVNLKKLELLEENIKKESNLVCMYAIRYLNRRMLECIATQTALKAGCIFAISHFCKEEGVEWNWDHPKVRPRSHLIFEVPAAFLTSFFCSQAASSKGMN